MIGHQRAVARARLYSKAVNAITTFASHAALSAAAGLFLIPFLWLVSTSLKPELQVFTDPIQWIPEPIMWRNYWEAWTLPTLPYVRLLANTIFYSGTTTIAGAISSTVVAYGFARIEFRGRRVLFLVVLSVMMLPRIVTLVPTYLLFNRLDWIGSYAPLVVPAFLGYPFYIFLIRQFLMGIPLELSDAARVDGAGDFVILFRVLMPLLRPVLLVVAVMQIMYTWNDFMGPLLYLQDPDKYPLVMALSAFNLGYGQIAWSKMMAFTLSTAFPLILLFFIAQKQFIENITITGFKGV
jgi:multiple sugar transport system permease protein